MRNWNIGSATSAYHQRAATSSRPNVAQVPDDDLTGRERDDEQHLLRSLGVA
jgi:hypothetical protein